MRVWRSGSENYFQYTMVTATDICGIFGLCEATHDSMWAAVFKWRDDEIHNKLTSVYQEVKNQFFYQQLFHHALQLLIF